MTPDELLKLCRSTPDVGKVKLEEFLGYIMPIDRKKKLPNGNWETITTPYVTVDGRVAMAVADHIRQGAKLTFHPPFVLVNDERQVTLTVQIDSDIYGSRCGTATSKLDGTGAPIEAQHAWEVCETSCIGRALACFAYGLLPGSGLASAEDMERAIDKSEPKPSKAQPAAPAPIFDKVKLLKYLENPDEGDPGVPAKIAQPWVDYWASAPMRFPTKGHITAEVKLLRDKVKQILVFDFNAALVNLVISRDEAKRLLAVDSLTDILYIEGTPPQAGIGPSMEQFIALLEAAIQKEASAQ